MNTKTYIVQLIDPAMGLPRVWGRGCTLEDAADQAQLALGEYLLKRCDLRLPGWTYYVDETEDWDAYNPVHPVAIMFGGGPPRKPWIYPLPPAQDAGRAYPGPSCPETLPTRVPRRNASPNRRTSKG